MKYLLANLAWDAGMRLLRLSQWILGKQLRFMVARSVDRPFKVPCE